MKKLILGVATLVIAVVAANAGTLNWTCGYPAASMPSGPGAGTDVTEGGGWIVGLYVDGGNGTIDAIGADGVSLGDDQLFTTGQLFDSLGSSTIYWYTALAPTQGTDFPAVGASVFSAVFDSSSLGDAMYYIPVDGLVGSSDFYTMPDVSGAQAVGTYDAGSAAGEWQPVPEPSSLALMALGVAALVARRFKK